MPVINIDGGIHRYSRVLCFDDVAPLEIGRRDLTRLLKVDAKNKIVKAGEDNPGCRWYQRARLESADATEDVFQIDTVVNQSGTAGYKALSINITENTTGTGEKRALGVEVGGVTKFKVNSDGSIYSYGEEVLVGEYAVTRNPRFILRGKYRYAYIDQDNRGEGLYLGESGIDAISITRQAAAIGFGITLSPSDMDPKIVLAKNVAISAENMHPEQILDIAGTAQLRRTADADATATMRDSNILQLQTAYWDGAASVSEAIPFQAVRSGTEANTHYLELAFTIGGSSGQQNFLVLKPTISQSGTAGYKALLIDITENTTGTGKRRALEVQAGGTTRFYIRNDGGIYTGDCPDFTIGSTWNGAKFCWNWAEQRFLEIEGSSNLVRLWAQNSHLKLETATAGCHIFLKAKVNLDLETQWGAIRYLPGGTEKARFTTTGLGIGTTSPEQLLDTAGTIQARRTANADATATLRDSNVLQLQTAYWDGAASVSEAVQLIGKRRSATAGDQCLKIVGNVTQTTAGAVDRYLVVDIDGSEYAVPLHALT